MKVLVACEESQRVCIAFRDKGCKAYSCDLQECSGGHPEWHIKGDCLPLLNGNCKFETQSGGVHSIIGKWDLIIAHPPCTYMSNAGARWMYQGGRLSTQRLKQALAAKEFFERFLYSDCDKIAVENPLPLKIVGLPRPTQMIQPYEYGHPYSKKTFLWLKNLPPLIPTKILFKHTPYLPSNTSGFAKGKGGSRGAVRGSKKYAKTFEGIAAAMAEQWTNPRNYYEQMSMEGL